jgi:anti-sigma factor RsiW
LAGLRSLRCELAALRAEKAPERLRQQILALIPSGPSVPRRRLAELAAASVAGLVLGLGGARLWPGTAPGLAEHDLLAAHARALLAGLPLQVSASDPHQVRPWLSAHLPAAPKVSQAEGFELLGARLDLVAGQSVAAILYRRRAHVVTVFAAGPEAAADWPRAPAVRRGFNLLPWAAGGLRYLAVSDLNATELGLLRDAFG